MIIQTDPSAYSRFAEVYDVSSRELAEETWRQGILKNLQSRQTLGKDVLDLGCGTGIGGRLMRDLKLSQIFGVDRSLEMLHSAFPYYSELLCCDLRALPMCLSRFDFIVSGFDTFNYLNHLELEAVFLASRSLLRDRKSRLLFDYSSPALLRQHWHDLAYDQQLGTRQRLRWRHAYSGAEHTTTWITLFEDEKQQWTEKHLQYTADDIQIAHLAKCAGLEVEAIQNIPGDGFTLSSHTHLYVLAPIHD
jgi:predicted TPR repeat methyltransferase